MARSLSACSWYQVRVSSSPRAAASSALCCASAIVASCSLTKASRSARMCGSLLRSDAAITFPFKPLIELTKLVQPLLDTGAIEREVLLIQRDDATLPFEM